MKFLRNVKGFSLIEGLVAAAVLAVGVSAITLYIVQSSRNTIALQGNSLCQTRSQMIIQTFKNGDNKANMSNWVYSGTSPATNLIPQIVAPYHPEIGMYGIVVSPSAAKSPFPILNPTYTNGWELIDSGTNWALSLVKTSNLYCQLKGNQWGKNLAGATASFGTYSSNKQLAPPPSTLNGETDYLNIQLKDNTTGTLSCPGSYQRIVPVGKVSLGDPNAGTNLSVLVTGTVVYTDENKIQRVCQAMTTLKPSGDNSPPSFVNPLGAAPYLMAPNPATVYCGTGVGTGNGLLCVKAPAKILVPPASPTAVACNATSNLEVAFQSSEAGSIFVCDVEYATTHAALPVNPNPNTSYLCGQGSYNIGGGGLASSTSLKVTPYGGPASNGSGELVTFSNTIDGFYRFFVTIYDSAENNVTQSIDFGVDNTRPGGGLTLIPPSPFIATFGGAGATLTRSHMPVTAPWSTAVSFGKDLFQCEDSLATDLWSATGGEPVPVALPGAVWSYSKGGGASVSLAGGKCVPTVGSPVGLADGTYVMKGYACDECGMAAPTPVPVAQTWYVDKAPAPITAHKPTNAPISDFGTAGAPLPTWSLSVAKPVPDLYQYACQNYLPNSTFSSQTSTCAPTGFVSGQPCSSQRSKGFSTVAFDGCGRKTSDLNTPYEIMAGVGQNCCNVPCRSDINLICSMDNSPSRGTCVNQTACAFDTDCGVGGTCYLPMGICHGGGNGPAPQTCGAALPTPTPAPTPTPVGTPMATPSPICPSASCGEALAIPGLPTINNYSCACTAACPLMAQTFIAVSGNVGYTGTYDYCGGAGLGQSCGCFGANPGAGMGDTCGGPPCSVGTCLPSGPIYTCQ